MASPTNYLIPLFISLSALLLSPVLSLTCTSQTFTGNRLYAQCADLTQLASYLHWTYDADNSSLSVAFVATPPADDGWVSWAINPTGTGMLGAQSLIAFKGSGGAMTVKTYDITTYASIEESELSFEVWDTAAESSGGSMTIFAKLKLPAKNTTVNHVWQVGSSVASGVPVKHSFQSANLNSKGTLDLAAGQSTSSTSEGDSKLKKRNIHGILNVVSWGILFPVGIIVARYLRTFQSTDPAWFYLHVFVQVSAYAIGVAGWGTGMKLGSESNGIHFTAHRNIGIALFTLATLQIFALFLRPKKDHKYRFYWNIYHHSVGYAVLVLGVLNVFKGLDMLDPGKKWKSAYIGVICALGAIALLLEAITWIIVLGRKSANPSGREHDQSRG